MVKGWWIWQGGDLGGSAEYQQIWQIKQQIPRA
jgi:hypothetical protein